MQPGRLRPSTLRTRPIAAATPTILLWTRALHVAPPSLVSHPRRKSPSTRLTSSRKVAAPWLETGVDAAANPCRRLTVPQRQRVYPHAPFLGACPAPAGTGAHAVAAAANPVGTTWPRIRAHNCHENAFEPQPPGRSCAKREAVGVARSVASALARSNSEAAPFNWPCPSPHRCRVLALADRS